MFINEGNKWRKLFFYTGEFKYSLNKGTVLLVIHLKLCFWKRMSLESMDWRLYRWMDKSYIWINHHHRHHQPLQVHCWTKAFHNSFHNCLFYAILCQATPANFSISSLYLVSGLFLLRLSLYGASQLVSSSIYYRSS